MPELPEVETVRRMLHEHVVGLAIRGVALSGARLREVVSPTLPRRLRGRAIRAVDRRGKYLIIRLDGELVLLSHLGMSGRWIYHRPGRAPGGMPHVHVRIRFADGSMLWFQDARRFGLLRLVPGARLERDAALRALGPDPLATPPNGARLWEQARGLRVSIKNFLLDQRRIAGIGNIYASEVLHRAEVDPRRRAGLLSRREWDAVAAQISRVLGEAIERMGTTFSMYRTLWGEPGGYGEQLRVYDRAGEPCRRCGAPIRRIVQAQRATFFCPSCQVGRRRPRVQTRSAAPR